LRQLLRCNLHAQAKLGLQQSKQLLIQLVNAFRSKFTVLSCQPTIRVTNAVGIGKLGCGEREGLSRQTPHLTPSISYKYLARLNLGNVVLRAALAITHTNLKRFFGNRFVREDANPDAPATLNMARHRPTRCLNLTRCQSASTDQCLQTELAKTHLGTHAWQGQCYGLSALCGTFF
jgi:hypothetical protein